jgi:O-antigen ligase
MSMNERLRRSFPSTTRDWLRFATIFAVLLVSLALGYRARPNQMILIMMAVAGIPIVLLLLRWPWLGILGVLGTGIFVDYLGPGGLNATVLLVILLVGLWVSDLFIFQANPQFVASATLPPLYGLIVLATLAFAMGQFPWFRYAQSAPLDAQAGGYAIYVLSFLAFILVANQIKELRHLEWITWGFVGIAAVNIVGLIIPTVRTIVSAAAGTIGSVFWIWAIAMIYGQALFNDEIKMKWRAALLAVVVAALFFLFILKFDNKSGWVPIVLVLWVITALRSWKLGLTATIVGLLGLLVVLPDVLDTEGYSLSTRLEILPVLWQIILANPLFGVGFGNYYFYAQLFSVRGWYVTINSHNNYVDVVAQIGLLGIGFFLWFLGQVALLAWSLRTRVHSGFEKAYVNASLGGLAGMVLVMGLGDWVLPFVYNIGLSGFRSSVMGWVFLGGLVVLENLVKDREPA